MNDFEQNSSNNQVDSQNQNNSEINIDTEAEKTTEQTPSAEVPKNKEKPIGSIIAVVIIIAILVIGGLYYWGKKINDIGTNNNTVNQNITAEEIAKQPDESLNKLKTQGTSDKPAAIEADLNSTNIKGLDTDIGKINAELGI